MTKTKQDANGVRSRKRVSDLTAELESYAYRRKPFNGDAGYVASRKVPEPKGGWCVIYDRANGGDWIDGDERWVVAAFDRHKGNVGLLDCRTRGLAIETMKLAQSGNLNWVAGYQEEYGTFIGSNKEQS